MSSPPDPTSPTSPTSTPVALKPRPRLLLILLVIFALWLGGLILLNFLT